VAVYLERRNEAIGDCRCVDAPLLCYRI
jgi:hypothetical protein